MFNPVGPACVLSYLLRMIPDEFERCGGGLPDVIGDLHDRREEPRRHGAHRAPSSAAARRNAVQLVGGDVDTVVVPDEAVDGVQDSVDGVLEDDGLVLEVEHLDEPRQRGLVHRVEAVLLGPAQDVVVLFLELNEQMNRLWHSSSI